MKKQVVILSALIITGSGAYGGDCTFDSTSPWSEDRTCPGADPCAGSCSELQATDEIFCRYSWCTACVHEARIIPLLVTVQLWEGSCKISPVSGQCACGGMQTSGDPVVWPVMYDSYTRACINTEGLCSAPSQAPSFWHDQIIDNPLTVAVVAGLPWMAVMAWNR